MESKDINKKVEELKEKVNKNKELDKELEDLREKIKSLDLNLIEDKEEREDGVVK